MGRRFDGLWLALGLLAIGCVAGCGGNGRPKTVPVTGRVTLDGHEPGEIGKLFFTPTQPAEGYSRRPANGSFNEDGSYNVSSWEGNDGLVPGHYTVTIVPAEPAKTKVAKKYQQNGASGLEVDVPVDQKTIEFNIDLHSK